MNCQGPAAHARGAACAAWEFLPSLQKHTYLHPISLVVLLSFGFKIGKL